MKHLPFITIEAIPHKAQAYETCGNYFNMKNSGVGIEVSKLSDWRYEALIVVHELIEYIIIKHQGISFKEIDEFDWEFEGLREEGNTDEPGDDPKSPYRKAHQFATMVEKLLAQILGVKWKVYNKEVNNLCQEK